MPPALGTGEPACGPGIWDESMGTAQAGDPDERQPAAGELAGPRSLHLSILHGDKLPLNIRYTCIPVVERDAHYAFVLVDSHFESRRGKVASAARGLFDAPDFPCA